MLFKFDSHFFMKLFKQQRRKTLGLINNHSLNEVNILKSHVIIDKNVMIHNGRRMKDGLSY